MTKFMNRISGEIYNSEEECIESLKKEGIEEQHEL